MRVLLINPWAGEVFPPPSLGYLQASIKTMKDVEVTAKDIGSALQDNSDYDLVTVSFHSFSVRYARAIRDKFKGRLVCGGHHPSALSVQMLSIGYDQVCIGEGEGAIREMILGNKEQIVYGIPDDINSIPFPDYTGFAWDNSMGIPVISSRGCPFACSFCASSSFWGKRWKMRTAENVVSEILSKGLKQFMFEDDNFTVNRQRVFDICDALMPHNIVWQCASRAETLQDEEMVIKLRQAGCHTVWLGIESLSQESLDRCGKHTTVEKMLKGIETAEKHGLSTMSQFISGIPDDTIKNIEETVYNIKRSKVRRKGANMIWLLPGTEPYRRAKERGFDDEVYLRSGAPFYTYEQDINTLIHWTNLINSA